MKKTEFLSILQESLEGNISRADIEENLQYYRSYFDDSDKSETEVCEELGDPRLIARTVIDACIASKGPMAEHYREQVRQEYQREQGGYGRTEYARDSGGEYGFASFKDKLLHIFIILVVVLVMIVIASVALAIFMKVILPLIVIFLMVMLIARIINGPRN